MKSYFNNAEDNMTFIINPDYTDIKKLKVQFRESTGGKQITEVNILYLAIVESIDYDNTLAFILYEKNGEEMIFSGGKNPDTSLYEIYNTKQSKREFFEILAHYENEYENNFFQNALKEHEYNTLNADVPKHTEKVIKKPKV